MKDYLTLMKIHKHFLYITAKLIEILEKNMKKAEENISSELRDKYENFSKHSHLLIESFNDDLHKLIRLNYELKELEETDKKEEENNERQF